MGKQKQGSASQPSLVSLPIHQLQELQEMLETVDKTIDALSESADDGLRKARKQLRRSAKRARGVLKHVGVDRDAAVSRLQSARSYVRQHPWYLVGLLAAAGAVTAVALSRGHTHPH